LGDDIPVELLELSLLQPASTNAARTAMANSGIFDFISLFSFSLFRFASKPYSPRQKLCQCKLVAGRAANSDDAKYAMRP
jgi:hypothetical protein